MWRLLDSLLRCRTKGSEEEQTSDDPVIEQEEELVQSTDASMRWLLAMFQLA
ncbi:uncharacterized protein CELE_R08A2.9 [Caenorhabditis elegans]|uniref:Uncharacterized protein n=1 Tax=Caenorhabditis elegans TaxID=6239 RepID=H2FLM0_CAEEL|nr:Uncharacterized protein CELE_R08A2.9 [Caenorhabditis elegans]CCF23364.2 Uncharacterized protein CELE_R08A2.9 [Caenorhabditis elegans]|eukprot:NP_001256615.2 Uncharacterized protein CELE_R08A2.9 [Caenorhabditis elegans]